MGPLHASHNYLADATWNEKLAAGVLIIGIVIMGLAPFLITKLITPSTEVIMNKILTIK